EACNNSVEKIIVIGGDGTVSETITGVRSTEFSPSVGILNLGTGGDFCKTIGVPTDINLALDKILVGKTISSDIGRIQFIKNDGTPGERNFINITGCGMSGEVVRTINKSKKMFGGFSYYLASLQNFLSYKNRRLRIVLDDKEEKEFKVVNLAICNGQYFGGGMQISPESQISDGYLNIVVVGDWGYFAKIIHSGKLYNGSILSVSEVYSFKAKKIKVIPLDSEPPFTYIDNDGEDIGYIPLEAEVIPGCVNIIV
ncbi:MAG: YegS/Rv2252/BmrU family lipid kinase, partial [Leptospiraceae bacterium]|nr:YegS/Rv2252/BmrU family lipid kinase [Leptospiraceae bacterium]